MSNRVMKEIENYILARDTDNGNEETEATHYGQKRRSGRYKWGSGENPYQHEDFLKRVKGMRARGMSEGEIAKEFGMSTTEFRIAHKLYSHQYRQELYSKATKMRDEGMSRQEIADKLGLPGESSVRSLLNEKTVLAKNKGMATAELLQKEIDKKGMVEIGAGVETQLGVSKQTLDEASYIAYLNGYNVYLMDVANPTNYGVRTTTTVATKPGITYEDMIKNRGDIKMLKDDNTSYSEDGGETWRQVERPSSLSSDRVAIRYAEDGGLDRDGTIEIRRGVEDLDLGNSNYAQVRILVDGNRYMKGMALYSDGSDMDDGVDVIYNSNKPNTMSKEEVLKKAESDPDNPFKAAIKIKDGQVVGQSHYIGADGQEHLSPINKLREEGDWNDYSKNLSSQFLSKQPYSLIKKQLDLTYADQESEFEEIMAITNPTVKKERLADFAEELESAAVQMKASALPRQSTKVILPLPSLKENEVYAPTYEDGEELALIRYPHGSITEIPIVRNRIKSPEGVEKIGPMAIDAIGINSKVAERLSGADFDGDTVMVIPVNDRVRIRNAPQFEALKTFRTSDYEYSSNDVDKWRMAQAIKEYRKEGKADAYIAKELGLDNEKGVRRALQEGNRIKIMSEDNKGREMGVASNLITDMTLKGANPDEIARAIKYSMVVIDAPKHKLNYKQCYIDNDIEELKRLYQAHTDENGNTTYGGASTLISMHKHEIKIPEIQGSPHIDDTGHVWYNKSGRTYKDKNGNYVEATSSMPKILAVDDVRSMSSGTIQENAYADYANKTKDLAVKARLAYKATGEIQYSKEAKAKYESEVESLNAKLRIANMNRPRERYAQVLANQEIAQKIKQDKADGIESTTKEIKAFAAKAMQKARIKAGAKGKESRIWISDREWEAIQSGAVSPSMLKNILRFADSDRVTQLSTPRQSQKVSPAKEAKIRAMKNSGYTIKEIAQAVGYSPTTIYKYINGGS